MRKRMLFIFFILIITTSCNKEEPLRSKETFNFEGIFAGIVEQDGTNLDGLKINYTATINGFNPKGEIFEVYNAEYPIDTKEKNIQITDETKIYSSINSEEIAPLEIKIGSKIDFTVRLVNNHIVEATKIKVLEEIE